MNIALWILQGVVAVSCLFHGWLYLFVPPFAPEMMACGNDSGFRLSHLLSRSIPAPSTTHVHVARVHAPSLHGGRCRGRPSRFHR
jgi:hypothetical protein